MHKLAIVTALALTPCLWGQNGVLQIVAGNGTTGTAGVGGHPLNAALVGGAICVDRFDNIYVADPSTNRVLKIGGGVLTLVAGNGVAASAGDNGPATQASLNNPTGVAVDYWGDVFIAEGNGHRVRIIDPSTGIIYTVAGNGAAGFGGDGGPALNASLNRPMGIALDADANLYIADAVNMRIRMVDRATRTIVTVVGTGVNGHSPDGTAATAANLAMPYAVSFDRQGNMLISELLAYAIRRVSVTTGLLSTVAGNGGTIFNGDGQPATSAALGYTGTNVASDAAGNLYFGDGTGRVRRVDAATGIITTVAGSGAGAHSQSSSGGGGGGTSTCPTGLGENGPATLATLDSPASVAIGSFGGLLISDPMDCHLFGVQLPSPLLYTNTALSLAGQSLNAAVTPIGGAIIPTGTVKFVEYVAFGPPLPLATVPLSGGGTATLDLGSLSAGSHQVMAIYMGDGAYNGSGSPALGVTGGGRATPSIGANVPYPIVVSTPATITFNVVGNSAQPSGTVQVLEGPALLTSVTLVNGAGSFSYQASTSGTHQITLQYSGDTAYTPLSWTFPVYVLVPSTLGLTADTNPATAGATVTFTASLSPPNGTGRIAFFDNGTTIASAQIVNGIATLPVSTLTTGTHSITAAYNGDFTVAPSTSSVYTETISLTPTTLTLTTSGSPSTFGQSVALDANITPASATGTVVFYDGALQLGSAFLSGGAARLTTTLLAAGTHTLTAVYNGSAAYAGSTSPAGSQTVNKATPVVTVTASATTVISPAWVTVTATMTPAWDGSSLQLMDGGNFTDGATTPTGTFSVSRPFSPGVHSLTVVCPGDANLNSVTSAPLTLTVQANTGLFLGAPFGSTIYGRPVAFTASIAAGATGTVQFSDGATVVGSSPIVNGVASLTLTDLTVGSHPMKAAYNGDGIYLATTSSIWVQTVTLSPTTISLASSLNPAAAGQPVVFTATLSPAATGTVQFLDGATPIGTAAISASTASLTTAALAAGSHSITVSYAGDANCYPATSAVLTETVTKSPTTITISASSGSISFGQNVTLTALVAPASATGTVQFMDGATVLGTGTVNGGAATLVASNLAVGAHAFTAVYSGDAAFNGSTSATVPVTVTKASSATVASAGSGTISFGQSVSLIASVTPASATGAVQFMEGATVLGAGTVIGGAATMVASNLAVGAHTITAVYAGDVSFTGSTSATVLVTVTKAGAGLTLVSSRNPSVAGQTVNFTATVTPATATGSVQFLDGSAVIGTVPLSGGTASLSTSGLATGSHAITAVYSGNASYNGATSSVVTQLVQAATTTSLSSNKSKAAEGQAVKFTATVAPSIATGSVQFLDGATVIGTVALSGGSASLSVQTLAAGTHSITASYLGSLGYAASVSGEVSLTIR